MLAELAEVRLDCYLNGWTSGMTCVKSKDLKLSFERYPHFFWSNEADMKSGRKTYAYHRNFEERCDTALFLKLDDPMKAFRFSSSCNHPKQLVTMLKPSIAMKRCVPNIQLQVVEVWSALVADTVELVNRCFGKLTPASEKLPSVTKDEPDSGTSLLWVGHLKRLDFLPC